MRSRANRIFIVRLMLATMLYAQAAFATAPCEADEHSAARAIAESAQTCHEREQTPNLCVSQCLAGDQNQYTPEIPVLAPPPVPALIAAVAPPSRLPERSLATPLRATHPPPRILFQSFQI
jgi:hypothetical protein